MSENYEQRKGWRNLELRHSAISIIDGDRGVNYPNQSEFARTGFCLFLNTGNIRADAFDFADCAFISEGKDALLRKGRILRGDIVLTTRGTVGSVAFFHDGIPFDVVRINSGMVILRCHEGLIARYAYQLFKSAVMKSQMQLFSSGSAQPQLPIKDLRRIQLPTPPAAIQRKIAAILTAYDDLIEANQRRIALLERMAEEIYREWFVRLRFPGHEKTKLTKGVPTGWRVEKLGTILELRYGKALKAEDRVAGPYLVYGSSGVVGSHNEAHVQGPGLVVGRKGNVGSVFLADTGFFVIDTAFYVASSLPHSFLYFLLRLMNFINNDSAVPGLNRNQAYSNQIFLPPEPLITDFAKIADPKFEAARLLREQTQLLTRTRDALLPRLISGKLRVDDLAIQFPPSMANAAPAAGV